MNYKLICILISFVFVSCVKNNKQKSEKLFFEIEKFYSENNFEQAKNLIDTLHANFPRQVEFRRKCDTLSWKMTIAEIKTELPKLNAQIESDCLIAEQIAKKFKFIKDEKYQVVGDYEHISMNTATNSGKNYLKPITDEKGNFRFISTLVGRKLNHRALQASVGGISGETQKASENNSNSYNDFGVNYETALFTTETAKDFILFIMQNADNQIKITLLGDKEYSYNLTKKEANIFVETFNFSLLLKTIADNQAKKELMEREFVYLREKTGGIKYSSISFAHQKQAH